MKKKYLNPEIDIVEIKNNVSLQDESAILEEDFTD